MQEQSTRARIYGVDYFKIYAVLNGFRGVTQRSISFLFFSAVPRTRAAARWEKAHVSRRNSYYIVVIVNVVLSPGPRPTRPCMYMYMQID